MLLPDFVGCPSGLVVDAAATRKLVKVEIAIARSFHCDFRDYGSHIFYAKVHSSVFVVLRHSLRRACFFLVSAFHESVSNGYGDVNLAVLNIRCEPCELFSEFN